VFVLNALAYFGESATATGATSVRPGQTITLHSIGAAETLQVVSPSGKSLSLKRERGENFSFSGTDELGVYRIDEPSQAPRRFAVNLFDSSESDIVPRPEINIGYNEVRGQAGWEGARRELWKPLLLGALGVLCCEWYIYSRRVHL
jgi:hypothetical protein